MFGQRHGWAWAWANRNTQYGQTRLTSPALVHAVQTDNLALLRQTNQGQEDIKFTSAEAELPVGLKRRQNAHDPGLLICAQLGCRQSPRNTSGCNSASLSVTANHCIKGVDVAVGYIGWREQAADEIGSSGLFAGRRHIPG